MALRLQSFVVALLLTSVSITAPASADFDSLASEAWREAWGPYPGVHGSVGATLAAAMVDLLGLPPGVARNPGTFLDAILESAVDVGPWDTDLPVRMGEFLWGTLASGDFYGIRDYQKVPFVREIANAYNCGTSDPACCNGLISTAGCPVGAHYGQGPCGWEYTWEEYEQFCDHSRETLVVMAVFIILASAVRCVCLDSPAGLAAFDRVVTNAADVEGSGKLVAFALFPDLWIPMLRRAAEAFGISPVADIADDVPVLIPTLVTQVLRLMNGALGGGGGSGPDVWSKMLRSASRGHEPPPGRGMQGANQGPGAGPCEPLVWSEREHDEEYETVAGFVYRDWRTFFYHYGDCTEAAHVPDQLFFGSEVSLPWRIYIGQPFDVRVLVSSFGRSPDPPQTLCPDWTYGCGYSVENTAAIIVDPANVWDFEVSGAPIRADKRDGATQCCEAAPQTGLSLLCGAATAGALFQLWAPLGLTGLLICGLNTAVYSAPSLYNWYRGINGEPDARGVQMTDAPGVSSWLFRVRTTLTREPSPNDCPEAPFACRFVIQRAADIVVQYPEGSEVAVPFIAYHAIQSSSFIVDIAR